MESKVGNKLGSKKMGCVKKYLNRDGIKYEVGTVNKFDCRAVYVSFGCWVTCTGNLTKQIESFRRRLRLNGYVLTHEHFKGHMRAYFTSIDYAEAKQHQRNNQTTFITFESTLYATDTWNWYDEGQQKLLRDYGQIMIELLKNSDGDFIFSSYNR